MKKGGHLTPEGLDQIKRIIERDKDSGNKEFLLPPSSL